jgi:hypothetical protein
MKWKERFSYHFVFKRKKFYTKTGQISVMCVLFTENRKQKWMELKIESTPKWFERDVNENSGPRKVKG